MSFFSEAVHRFLPIPEDRKIETKQFLDAASEIVPFFGEHNFRFKDWNDIFEKLRSL